MSTNTNNNNYNNNNKQLAQQLWQKLLATEQQTKHLEQIISSLKQNIHHRDLHIEKLNMKLQHCQQKYIKILENNNQKQIILKQTNITLYNKNLQIQQLQELLKSKQLTQNNMNNEQIANMSAIIKQQQKQLNEMMQEHVNMVNTFQQIYQNKKIQYQEKQLLMKFNQELLGQIQEVEQINGKLLEDRVSIERQLVLQNQQGNDLLCQIQVMVDTIAG